MGIYFGYHGNMIATYCYYILIDDMFSYVCVPVTLKKHVYLTGKVRNFPDISGFFKSLTSAMFRMGECRLVKMPGEFPLFKTND